MSERIALFKSSAADVSSYDPLWEFLPQTRADSVVALITTASNPEPENGLVLKAEKALDGLGFTEVIHYDLDGKREEQVRDDLSWADIIFIAGGNTYYLLDRVKKSGFDKAIPDLLDDGKIFIGSSAGSTIAGPSIAIATSRNDVGLEDRTGLGLIPFTVTSHYKPEKYEDIKTRVSILPEPVVAIADTQAVLMVGNRYSLVGSGNRIYFDKGRGIPLL